MAQRESFELAPATLRFTMDRKYPDSTSIAASPGTSQIFATTHKDHPHPPCTRKFTLISTQNIDLGSLLCYLKYITLHVTQVFNRNNFHYDLSIELSVASKTDTEVLTTFLDLDISRPFITPTVLTIYHIINSYLLQT